MKRFFALIIAFLFLFFMVAPVFSFAAFPSWSIVAPFPDYSSGSYSSCVIGANSEFGYQFSVSINNLPSEVTVRYYITDNGVGNWQFRVYVTNTSFSNFSVDLYIYNLINGSTTSYNIPISYSSGTVDNTGRERFYILNINDYLSSYTSYYIYILSTHTGNIIYNSRFTLSSTNFVVFAPSGYNESITYSNIPCPVSTDRIFYIADHQYLYQIAFVCYYGSEENNNNELDFIQCRIAPDTSNINYYRLYFSFSNNASTTSRYIYINTFSLVDGYFVRSNSIDMTNHQIGSYLLDLHDYDSFGVWYSGNFILDNCTFPLLKITWSDESVVHSDLLAITSLINNILSNVSTINTYIQSMDSYLYNINNHIYNFMDIANQYFQWYRSTYYNNWQDNWEASLYKLTDIYIELNTIDIMMYSYIVPDIQAIKNALVDHTESQPDTSAFDDSISEYESGESFVVNQAESALDDFESQISNASNVLSVNSRGLLFVKQIFENFAFTGLNYYYILFVLVLGSVALLIGRRLR